MRYLNISFSLLLLFFGYTIAGETDTLNLEHLQVDRFSSLPYMSLIFDPGLSMRSGSENVLTVHHWLTHTEDRHISIRWFSERGIWGKTGGVVLRFAKLALLDVPVDYFSVVFAHEYFGHGARYRELNIGNVDYGFDNPPPYGKGGGQASVNYAGLISNHELLAIWSGGIEVHSIINRLLNLHWLIKKEIDYREAFLYFWSWQIGFNYIQSTSKDITTIEHDNDPQAYIRIINLDTGYSNASHLLMNVEDLKARSKINLANPFLFYSIFTATKTYLWSGNTSTKLPTLKIAGIEYLPSFRMALTPFGLEYHFENYIRWKNNVTSIVVLQLGDQEFHKNWGGVGFVVKNFYTKNRLSLDMNLHAWNQPKIQLTNNVITSKGGGLGVALSLRGYYDFTDSQNSPAATAELGYKSAGFLEGYRLESSPIILLGIAFRQ